MSMDSEIKGIIPNYYAFIVDKLNRIYNAEDENNYPLALERALKLCKYLPRKLKEQIKQDAAKIEQRLFQETRTSGYFSNIIDRSTKQKVWRISFQEEPKLMDKLTSLLDSENLLTMKRGIATREQSMGDIQRTVDVARYEAEH